MVKVAGQGLGKGEHTRTGQGAGERGAGGSEMDSGGVREGGGGLEGVRAVRGCQGGSGGVRGQGGLGVAVGGTPPRKSTTKHSGVGFRVFSSRGGSWGFCL